VLLTKPLAGSGGLHATSSVGVALTVGVGVRVDVGVGVRVDVGVGVRVDVGVGVRVGVGVGVRVGIGVGVRVGIALAVSVGMVVNVAVVDGVIVLVGRELAVSVAVGVMVGICVIVGVGIGVTVGSGVTVQGSLVCTVELGRRGRGGFGSSAGTGVCVATRSTAGADVRVTAGRRTAVGSDSASGEFAVTSLGVRLAASAGIVAVDVGTAGTDVAPDGSIDGRRVEGVTISFLPGEDAGGRVPVSGRCVELPDGGITVRVGCANPARIGVSDGVRALAPISSAATVPGSCATCAPMGVTVGTGVCILGSTIGRAIGPTLPDAIDSCETSRISSGRITGMRAATGSAL
jgi:hypothetical protein